MLEKQVNFRCKLAEEMVNNEYDNDVSPSKMPRSSELVCFEHRLLSLKEGHHTFKDTTEVKCKI